MCVCVCVCMCAYGMGVGGGAITYEIYCNFMPVLVKLMISQENIAFLVNDTF